MRANRRHTEKSSRSEIAHTAARLLAEGVAETFAEAKRKAAEMLGLGNIRAWPENIAVHRALIEYQAVFGGEAHRALIARLRREAHSAMLGLSVFEPRLVGPVLYGTACDYSPVTLHLYTDEFEAVTRFLHEHGMSYRIGETQLQTRAKIYDTFPSFEVVNGEVDFDIVVLPYSALTSPPLSSLDGRPFKRATAAALGRILNGPDPAGPFTDHG